MTEAKNVSAPLRDPAHSPGVDWMRLENLVGTGMPDINGCLNGVETWVETKLVKGNRLRFEPTQPAWIMKRVRHGGRVFVFARHQDTFLLWAGWPSAWTRTAKPLSDGGTSVDYRDAGPVLVIDRPYDWKLLMEVLFTRPFKSS
ncbi:hypothetical protein [uncultured Paludibaculum sp.]|uniref:hypothetical protein n=1 Tax=uncultured Paludibaculum sp. TaxID=1765020 RepID=UPI002AAA7303|nr:hypothetical protein [uncultured Paludibaculum sp.]